jgi:hypothetical protein
MSVCQMMTGQGGWPLTIFMTSEKKPFFAGTYFPRESRFAVLNHQEASVKGFARLGAGVGFAAKAFFLVDDDLDRSLFKMHGSIPPLSLGPCGTP